MSFATDYLSNSKVLYLLITLVKENDYRMSSVVFPQEGISTRIYDST